MYLNAFESAAASPHAGTSFTPEYFAPRRPKQPALALIEDILADDFAEEVSVISLKGKSSIADSILIATGKAARHLDALAERIRDAVKSAGYNEPVVEGKGDSGWVLVDAGDIIVHLFRAEARKHYNLERMWGATFSAE
ncbi:MAG: ribosome silencing factor [Alphaproteobacteria bacterium]|jgi:ribosome-associated protein|nr:ribosome silencing factor [Thalassospira sp.]MCE2964976.1 ribosome silencing factor [Alphaproteobacteria bacterium]